MKKINAILAALFLATTGQAQTESTIPEKPELILVEGGTFMMGNEKNESDERPVHQVTVSSYQLGKYEVTVGQYKAFCNATGTKMPNPPTWGWIDNHPMVSVSHNNAVAYCNWLSLTYGGNWHLPTEAEWEFAARGGNQSKNFMYSGSNTLGDCGWYLYNSNGSTQPVGGKIPNELGFYDMSGNAWEWCSDWWGMYESTALIDPTGPATGEYRIQKGGTWNYSTSMALVSCRDLGNPYSAYNYYGFRVALSYVETQD
jgi:sulfatase modifying factor 1